MKKQIFLVDDDTLFATLMADHLEETGRYDVTTFPTGEACLERLGEKPDAIILDYFLDSNEKEAMNGLEVLKKIHKIDPEQKVIMLSSQERYGVALQTIASGAVQYVIKDLGSVKAIDDILREL